MRQNNAIKGELKTANADLDFKKVELGDLYKDIKRVKGLTEEIVRQVAEVEKEKQLVDAKREDIKDDVKSATRETATQRKQSDILKKQVDDLVREREILNKSLVKAEEKTRRMYDLIKINENKKKNLENEINGFKVEALKQRQHIEQLEEEVKRYEREGTVAHRSITRF